MDEHGQASELVRAGAVRVPDIVKTAGEIMEGGDLVLAVAGDASTRSAEGGHGPTVPSAVVRWGPDPPEGRQAVEDGVPGGFDWHQSTRRRLHRLPNGKPVAPDGNDAS